MTCSEHIISTQQLLTRKEMAKGVIIKHCYACGGSTKHQTVNAAGEPVKPRLTYYANATYPRLLRHFICLRCNRNLAKKQKVNINIFNGVDILT